MIDPLLRGQTPTDVDTASEPLFGDTVPPVVQNTLPEPALLLTPILKNVPFALRHLNQWVVWQAVWQPMKGKYSKVPFNARTYDGVKAYGASTTDPADWSSFEEAVTAYDRSREPTPFPDAVVFAGVGFVLCDADPFVGIDLDNAIGPDRELIPSAFDRIGALDTYTEVSPSGAGIRMFAKGSLPPGRRKSSSVEMYESGRFLTITGRRWPETNDQIEPRQDQIEALHAAAFPPAPPIEANQRPRSVPAVVTQDDSELLDIAFNAKNGAVTRALYSGDMSSAAGDHSAADLALVNKLVFYTHDSPDRLDRLFRNSGLMRDKWDQVRFANKETYGQRTIRMAIEGCNQFYSPPGTALAFEKFAGTALSQPLPPVASDDLQLVAPELTDEQKRQAIADGKRKERAARRAKRSEKVVTADGLPIIETNDRHLRDVAQDAYNVMVQANDPPCVFVRSGALVRITTNEKGVPIIGMMAEATMRHRLARAANFVSTSEDRGTVPVAPGTTMINDIFAFPNFEHLPPLEGIVTAPVIAPDGSLMTAPGYIAQASVYHYQADKRAIPRTEPTTENIAAAKALLLDTLLADFPFADDSSRAHALALVLQPFVRSLIRGNTPLYLVDAPTQGTGKTLLTQVAGAVFVGRLPDAIGCPDKRDNEEWRKLITTQLVRGVSHIIFDNLKQRLDSAALAIALTAPEWTDRILGTNTSATIPIKCTWALTGNNIDLDGDFPRRSVWIRLDSKAERPEDRDPNCFKVDDIEDWVIAERPRLIGAALTLIRAWLDKGQPVWTGKPLGGYIAWSRIIGGILETIGVPGFFANREELYERADPEREKWAALVRIWRERWQATPIGVSDIIPIAIDCEIVAEDNRGARNVLGRMLRSHEGAVFGDLVITVSRKKKAGAAQYICESNESNERNAHVRGESLFATYTDDTGPKTDSPRRDENHPFVSFDSQIENNGANQEEEREDREENEAPVADGKPEEEELF